MGAHIWNASVAIARQEVGTGGFWEAHRAASPVRASVNKETLLQNRQLRLPLDFLGSSRPAAHVGAGH